MLPLLLEKAQQTTQQIAEIKINGGALRFWEGVRAVLEAGKRRGELS
jgi:hypothetical protein